MDRNRDGTIVYITTRCFISKSSNFYLFFLPIPPYDDLVGLKKVQNNITVKKLSRSLYQEYQQGCRFEYSVTRGKS